MPFIRIAERKIKFAKHNIKKKSERCHQNTIPIIILFTDNISRLPVSYEIILAVDIFKVRY